MISRKMNPLLLTLVLLASACTRGNAPELDAGTSSGATQSGEATSCAHDAKTLRCVKYLKNYDADTITFDIPGVHPLLGEKISVSVNGVDAPEMKGANQCEKDSARIARNLVENVLKKAQRIDLTGIERDKYFRILADVVVDGQNVKDILFRNGLAYEYHGGTKRKVDWCKVAKGGARLPSSAVPVE